MTYLMLYGHGWTQRWQIAEDALDQVTAAIARVGREETGYLPIIDPGTGEPTSLVIAWQQVAAAVLLDTDHTDHTDHAGPASVGTAGQYP